MKTILLIEDNLEIRENTSEILELEGYRIVTATNGRTGLELALQIIPDLILCDIMMPEMDGHEVLRQLKLDERVSYIPFVFISASTEKSEVMKGLGMGANEYIRKPFEESELFEIVDSFLKENSRY